MALDLWYLALAGVSWALVWGLARGCARLQAPASPANKEPSP